MTTHSTPSQQKYTQTHTHTQYGFGRPDIDSTFSKMEPSYTSTQLHTSHNDFFPSLFDSLIIDFF